jgi:WD40 repeat protein
VTFSPDGSRLAAAYANGTVIIWNATSGRRERTLEGPLQYVSSVAFSPDGKSLASATGNWTRQEVDGLVELWEVASGKHLARGEGHKGPVYCVAFAPDGRSVASGGTDGTPRIWDAKDARCLNSLPKQADWIFSIAYAPDGQTIATGEQMSVRLLEPNTGKLKGVLHGHRGQVEAVAFSPDGRSIASGGRDRLIKHWDAASHRERVTLSGHAGWVTSLAFATNSLTLAAAGLNGDHSKEVRLWDTASARTIAILPDVNSHSVAVSPDEQTIATGNLSGSVQVWRIDEIVKVGK